MSTPGKRSAAANMWLGFVPLALVAVVGFVALQGVVLLAEKLAGKAGK